MENDAKPVANFASIKERWKQNATKYGSPLPGRKQKLAADRQRSFNLGRDEISNSTTGTIKPSSSFEQKVEKRRGVGKSNSFCDDDLTASRHRKEKFIEIVDDDDDEIDDDSSSSGGGEEDHDNEPNNTLNPTPTITQTSTTYINNKSNITATTTSNNKPQPSPWRSTKKNVSIISSSAVDNNNNNNDFKTPIIQKKPTVSTNTAGVRKWQSYRATTTPAVAKNSPVNKKGSNTTTTTNTTSNSNIINTTATPNKKQQQQQQQENETSNITTSSNNNAVSALRAKFSSNSNNNNSIISKAPKTPSVSTTTKSSKPVIMNVPKTAPSRYRRNSIGPISISNSNSSGSNALPTSNSSRKTSVVVTTDNVDDNNNNDNNNEPPSTTLSPITPRRSIFKPDSPLYKPRSPIQRKQQQQQDNNNQKQQRTLPSVALLDDDVSDHHQNTTNTAAAAAAADLGESTSLIEHFSDDDDSHYHHNSTDSFDKFNDSLVVAIDTNSAPLVSPTTPKKCLSTQQQQTLKSSSPHNVSPKVKNIITKPESSPTQRSSITKQGQSIDEKKSSSGSSSNQKVPDAAAILKTPVAEEKKGKVVPRPPLRAASSRSRSLSPTPVSTPVKTRMSRSKSPAASGDNSKRRSSRRSKSRSNRRSKSNDTKRSSGEKNVDSKTIGNGESNINNKGRTKSNNNNNNNNNTADNNNLVPRPKIERNKSHNKRRQHKQAVIFREIQSTEPVLPKNDHSDYEEDTILQALYNKQDLFRSLTVLELSKLVSAFETGTVQFNAGDIIIEEGDTNAEYFYVMEKGLVEFTINDEHVGTAQKGDSFGELSLLYETPRAVTVLALEDCQVYRVHTDSFKAVLHKDCQRCVKKKNRLLQGIQFLDILPISSVKNLSESLIPRYVDTGTILLEKGSIGSYFYILADGQVHCRHYSVPGSSSSSGSTTTKYQDVILNPGDYFGERSLITNESIMSTIRAKTSCLVFTIKRRVFEKILQPFKEYIFRDEDIRRLASIQFINTATKEQIFALAKLLKERKFPSGETLFKAGERTTATLYIIRKGSVMTGDTEMRVGGYFGEPLLQKASTKSKKTTKAPYTAKAKTDCVCALLSIKDIWSVLEPSRLDKSKNREEADEAEIEVEAEAAEPEEALPVVTCQLKELKKKAILGEGTFGRVWLVTDRNEKNCYALKVQSKSFLIDENQVEAVIQEKIMLDNMKHPFLINLFRTYQDPLYIYMLLEFVQGGELFSLMHEVEDRDTPLPEGQAKFYALSLVDVLAYLHRGKYLYRDLKPENVMIDHRGYVKLIDFGFCKYMLADKTYTLVGTPGYLAPEIVTMEGHNWGVDYWAVGILIYEMLTGSSPFYYEDIDQVDLFDSIVNDDVKIPSTVSTKAADIITKLLIKDPSKRLGATNSNDRFTEIMEHDWFIDLNIEALRKRKIPAPWKPDLSGPFDRSYFNDWSDLENNNTSDDESKKGKVLSARDAKLFEGVF